MSDVITVSLSRQSGLYKELSIVAQNIANVGTDGYKREAAVFAEYIDGRPGDASLSMGSLRGHVPDMVQGELRETGGRLDVAIDGDGWFGIQRGEEILLTRAGRFQRDAEGLMVTADGYPLVDDAGAPVQLPEGAADITIGVDGTITSGGFAVAQVGVLTADPQNMVRVGDNLWRNEGPLGFVADPVIRQGFVETSNVSAVTEMARLIETQRLFEAGSSLQSDEDERLRQLIEAIGRQA